MVIKNSCDEVLLSNMKMMVGIFSPAVAEAHAILHGMQLASSSGLLPSVVESDCRLVINILRSGSLVHAEVGLVFDDILSLRNSFKFVDFVFSPRGTNKVAHNLVKLALCHGVNCVLLEKVLPSLSRLIQEETIFN
ncbi:hypothetical protein ACOSP7_020917 [Xanthoceras sorbifolium]